MARFGVTSGPETFQLIRRGRHDAFEILEPRLWVRVIAMRRRGLLQPHRPQEVQDALAFGRYAPKSAKSFGCPDVDLKRLACPRSVAGDISCTELKQEPRHLPVAVLHRRP